jgi:hypothetical protein
MQRKLLEIINADFDATAICRFQASLLLSYEVLVQYYHGVWLNHETGEANKNVSELNLQQSPGG